MKREGSLRKFAEFWLIPFFAGCFFAIGYEFTSRQLALENKPEIPEKIPTEERTLIKTDMQTKNSDTSINQALKEESPSTRKPKQNIGMSSEENYEQKVFEDLFKSLSNP